MMRSTSKPAILPASVEIGRYGDYRLGNFLTEETLGRFLHLLQNEGGNLTGAVVLAIGFHPGVAGLAFDNLVGNQALVLFDCRILEVPTDQPLDGEQGVFRVGHRLALGRLTDQRSLVGKADHGRRGARALGVLNHAGILAVHNGQAGVCGSEINTDNFSHVYFTSFGSRLSLAALLQAPPNWSPLESSLSARPWLRSLRILEQRISIGMPDI